MEELNDKSIKIISALFLSDKPLSITELAKKTGFLQSKLTIK
jgi:DNA-binding transcriptional regulator GbsR (MarR family)